MQSNEVNKYLGQSLKRNANNPDEDAQGENDKDDTHDECAKDGSHEVVELDFGLRDAIFEALVMNVYTICLPIKKNYKTNLFN